MSLGRSRAFCFFVRRQNVVRNDPFHLSQYGSPHIAPAAVGDAMVRRGRTVVVRRCWAMVTVVMV